MTTWAQPADVERAAQHWSPAQIECRTYGHAWRPQTVRHRPGVYSITQICGRCWNTRRMLVNEGGYPLSQWDINYQPGYLLENVGRIGADGRAVLRLTTIRGSQVVEEPGDE